MPARIPIDSQRIAAFCRRWKITEFALFGSVLRDDFRGDSDVDVLVTFEEGHGWSLFDLVKMTDELEARSRRAPGPVHGRALLSASTGAAPPAHAGCPGPHPSGPQPGNGSHLGLRCQGAADLLGILSAGERIEWRSMAMISTKPATATESTMKAIIQDRYGSPDDVLELKDIDKPVVKDDEVLVRVHAAGVNISDWILMRGVPYVMRLASGLRKPRNSVPGDDIAGKVEAVGKNVKQLQPGDEVFGWCKGAFAEYACAGEDNFVPKPANLTFEQAAAVGVSAATALQALRDHGKVQPGQKVLINGASGGVGTFAVQIAKSFGADVTGVCSARNVDRVRSIGADQVIDYTQEDFTKSGQRYDLILDNVANHSLSDFRRALTPKGILLPNGGGHLSGGWFRPLGSVIKALVLSLFVRQQGRPFLSLPDKEDLATLKELTESGKVTPVIDRTYPLSETPAAIGHVGEGHAQGKTVITVSGADHRADHGI
jgi:NADPH:quinone reductase-like Zn-dependent oxidoreductase/predicted nucleotidyltransferase